jgi:hypothetical protein
LSAAVDDDAVVDGAAVEEVEEVDEVDDEVEVVVPDDDLLDFPHAPRTARVRTRAAVRRIGPPLWQVQHAQGPGIDPPSLSG